ncbi:hypothetical protein [Deinococcus misasensis]|uniref:hypothetical protein n=1 Tax=Deinococcus misasensis TaxID=392413 RepID=UPI0005586F01|nr:hypothetical protein [Deinococcus misasensis]
MFNIEGKQLLSKPDGNILGLLTDPRLVSTAVGAVTGAVAEKAIFSSQRAAFGVAVPTADGVKYKKVDQNGAVTNQDHPQAQQNRALLHAGMVIGSIAAIEYIPNLPGPLQYIFFGVAVVSGAHLAQSLFPSLK